MKNIILNGYGNTNVFNLIESPNPSVGPKEVLIRHTAIGVNKIDIQCRMGEYNTKTCGIEACGIIERVGEEVGAYNVGDKVVYMTPDFGSYSTKRVVHENYIVKAPDDISDDVLIASFAKGLTAHYLTYRTLAVVQGMGILVHDASSVTGQYLAKWVSASGALLIGAVKDDKGAEIAKKSGCHHTITYGKGSLADQIKECTGGLLLNAVYHSVDPEMITESLECLRSMGMLIIFDQPGHKLGSIHLAKLQEKSLFLTCPTIKDYKHNRKEFLLSAEEVFGMVRSQQLEVTIDGMYKLEQVYEAHQAFENSYGSIVIVP